LNDTVSIYPTVTIERLGLVHYHLIIPEADETFLQCPFAVEAVWLTPDFINDTTLYLHLVVPDHNALPSLPSDAQAVSSTSGWQSFLPSQPIAVPYSSSTPTDLVQRNPLIVPAVFEGWGQRHSLSTLWSAITVRLGTDVRHYVRHERYREQNGRTYLRRAFQELARDQTFRQTIVRHRRLPRIEAFILSSSSPAWLDRVTAFVVSIEVYPTIDGTFARLEGSHDLLDALLALPEDVRRCVRGIWFRNAHRVARSRFAYEQLFDPRTGTWRVKP